MTVTIRKLTDDALMRRACEMTLRPGLTSKASLAALYRCEHSPIRTQLFWIELHGVETFVSVHLVRHKTGVEHFVQSNRDDRGGAGDEVVTRETPVNHGMLINAAALIQMSRKRLCLLSHKRTVAWWTKVRKAVFGVDADLSAFMVPECSYRNGVCPELRQCAAGPEKVCAAYAGGAA
jgi:hypothetical protein